MAIPGFFAEMSLFSTGQTYLVSRTTSSQYPQVTPQMTMQCLVQALGLYSECLAGGYDCRGQLDRMFDVCRLYS